MAEPKKGDKPIVIEETPGKRAYCQCGWSERLPHCDGSHKQQCPDVGPMVCEITEPGRKAVCQCGRSGDLPWCDGSHKQI
jgi:CDGSH-type Zn-finger protein